MKLNYAIIAILVFAAALLVLPASAATGVFLNGGNYINVANPEEVPVVGSVVQFTTPPAPLVANVNYYVVYVSTGSYGANFIRVASSQDGTPVKWVIVNSVTSVFSVVSTVAPQQSAYFLTGGNYIYAPNTPLPASGTKVTFVTPPSPLTGGTTYYVVGGFYKYFQVSKTVGGTPLKWSVTSNVVTTLSIVPNTVTAKHR